MSQEEKIAFNPYYEAFVQKLPPYILEKVKKQIEKKYKIDDSNEDIDTIFQKYANQYQRKREYDKKYFQQKSKNNNESIELTKLQLENNELKQHLTKASQVIKKLGNEIKNLQATVKKLQSTSICSIGD
jgi:conjugal transfer/entry exclusion protein